MYPPSPEDLLLLHDARKRAAALVESLVRQQKEVEASPPELPPEQLAAGRFAINKAIESAQRMLKNIDDALAMAVRDSSTSEASGDDEHERTAN